MCFWIEFPWIRLPWELRLPTMKFVTGSSKKLFNFDWFKITVRLQTVGLQTVRLHDRKPISRQFMVKFLAITFEETGIFQLEKKKYTKWHWYDALSGSRVILPEIGVWYNSNLKIFLACPIKMIFSWWHEANFQNKTKENVHVPDYGYINLDWIAIVSSYKMLRDILAND